jgi:ribosomal protein S27E
VSATTGVLPFGFMPAQRFPCPSCNANLVFDPESGQLKCPYCGTTQTLPQAQENVKELPFSELGRETLEPMSAKALEVSCSSCGSVVTFEPPEVAGTCPFCAAAIVAQPKSADPIVAPHALLPFRVSQQNATTQIQTWLASRWFAPNGLKQVSRPDGIQGVYLPSWTFDAEAHTDYSGERGDYYYVNETRTTYVNGRQVEQVVQVRHTRWSQHSGSVYDSFDDVLINATKSVDRGRLDELAPWDLNQLTAYEPGFLAGFKAQRYQLDVKQAWNEAQQVMRDTIHSTVCNDIGGDEQRVYTMTPAFSNVTFKHLLLPVYIGAYRFQGKVYQVLVNARTGEVQGERPYSTAKIALAILVVILILWIYTMVSR